MPNFIWSLAGIIIASGVHALLRILIAQTLDETALGVYTILFTLYYFFLIFASFGIGAGLTKYIAEHDISDPENPIKRLVSSGVVGGIVTGLLTALCLIILSPYLSQLFLHSDSYAYLIIVIAIALPFLALQKLSQGIYNGFTSMKEYALSDIILNTGIIVLTLLFVNVFKFGVDGAIYAILISTIFIGIYSYLINIRKYFSIRLIDFSYIKLLIYFGLFVVLSNSIGYVNSKASELIMGVFMSPADVGVFAVATTMIVAMSLIPSAIQRLTIPAMSRHYAKGSKHEFDRTVKKAMLLSFLSGLVIAGIFLIFGRQIISIFFGAEYLGAYVPLMILTVGYIIYGPFISIGGILACVNKININFCVTTISAVVNIVLCIIFIQFWGMIGVAFATVISLLCQELLVFCVLKRRKLFPA